MNKYMYPAEKFAAARRTLMAPHPGGEAQSVASAFHECHLGLQDIEAVDLVDGYARDAVGTIRRTIGTRDVVDPDGSGTWQVKAEGLSEPERRAFAAAVDVLATWFDCKSRGV